MTNQSINQKFPGLPIIVLTHVCIVTKAPFWMIRKDRYCKRVDQWYNGWMNDLLCCLQSCQRTGRTPRRHCWRGWCSTWSTWAWRWWASPKERTWLLPPSAASSPRWGSYHGASGETRMRGWCEIWGTQVVAFSFFFLFKLLALCCSLIALNAILMCYYSLIFLG